MSEQRFSPAVLPGAKESPPHSDVWVREVQQPDGAGVCWEFQLWQRLSGECQWVCYPQRYAGREYPPHVDTITLPPDITQADAEMVLEKLGFPNLPRRFDGERWGFLRDTIQWVRPETESQGVICVGDHIERDPVWHVYVFRDGGAVQGAYDDLKVPVSSDDTAAIIAALREHGVEIEEVEND